MSPRLLLLGAGDAHYRRYSLEALSREFRVTLLDASANEWQRGLADEYIEVAHREPDVVLNYVQRNTDRFDGVFTYDEFAVESAAVAGAAAGLRANSTPTARACRDKTEMRATLAASNVPSTRSVQVNSREEAHHTAREIGFPVVLKPRALAGSIGVIRVDAERDLDAAYDISLGSGHGTYGSASGQLLVEEYLDGPEISVECVVRDGAPEILAVTRKTLGPAPYFEEVGHTVAPEEPVSDDDSAILTVVRAAHQAVGITWGATHTELRLTRAGPRIIEIGARPGGDLIPLLVRLATGRDQVVEAAAAVCGLDSPTEPTVSRKGEPAAAAIRFIYPQADSRLVDARLAPAVASAPWLYAFTREVEYGTALRVPPRAFLDRVGFAVARADSAALCQQHLDDFENGLTLTFEKLGEAG